MRRTNRTLIMLALGLAVVGWTTLTRRRLLRGAVGT